MTISIKHAKTSGAGPASDPSLVGGDDWDDEHPVTLAEDKLMGRASSGAGPVEEVDCTAFGRLLIANADAAAARSDLELGTAATLAAGSANGVATLDAGGKMPVSQLPALALTETYVVAGQAAMLALSAAETGDIAVRTDENKSYILAGADPATLGHWQELLTPTGGVASFNGRSGTVTPQTGDYVQANITGLTTADSPQLAGLNLGHASDTTLTRASAGNLAVEGNLVYRAGGTDVPLTDGGTGASDATGARANFGIGTGDSPQFTAINIGHASDSTLARTSAGILNVEGVDLVNVSATQFLTNKTLTGTKETVFTITDGAAFEINPANGGIQQVTLGANRTPAASSFAAGQSVLLGIDDGTARTITWTTVAVVWIGGSAPTLATTGWTWVELWKVGSTIYGAHVGNSA